MNFLEPNVKRFRKKRKGRHKGTSSSCNELNAGNFGLMALTHNFLTAKQYESARKAFVQASSKKTRLIPRFHLNHSRTSKPTENRMGKGKGDIDYWAFRVKPGRVVFEVKDLTPANYNDIMAGLKAASYKLPFRVKILTL